MDHEQTNVGVISQYYHEMQNEMQYEREGADYKGKFTEIRMISLCKKKKKL